MKKKGLQRAGGGLCRQPVMTVYYIKYVSLPLQRQNPGVSFHLRWDRNIEAVNETILPSLTGVMDSYVITNVPSFVLSPTASYSYNNAQTITLSRLQSPGI